MRKHKQKEKTMLDWISFPKGIILSKKLSSEDKVLWGILLENLNERGYCTLTNTELAEILGVKTKTITLRLNSLKQKNFINIFYNSHKHKRYIYLRPPRVPSSFNQCKGPLPGQLKDTQIKLQESLKKAIILGEIDFDVLVQKLLSSTYLENVKNNEVQFCVSDIQIQFLEWIKNYLKKEVDCQIAGFANINYQLLKNKILESEFLMLNKNLSLRWLLTHYNEIINDKYKIYVCENYKKTFSQRNFSSNLNSLFESIDDIEI